MKTPGFRLDETLAAWERRYIDAALKLGHGNLSQAARLLGVNRTTLYSKIERLANSRG
ncbi:MAG: helix-turn-helix domain-containing protein [Burkholderiales bacterium]